MKRKFLNNKSGVAWVWAVCFIAMGIYTMAWYATGLATMMTIDALEATYTYPAPMSTTITFIRTLFAWHPFIMLIGLALWAFINSQRREDQTYQI